MLSANGASGQSAQRGSELGGGGGGSGGAILLEARKLVTTGATIDAEGGDGGLGSDEQNTGALLPSGAGLGASTTAQTGMAGATDDQGQGGGGGGGGFGRLVERNLSDAAACM